MTMRKHLTWAIPATMVILAWAVPIVNAQSGGRYSIKKSAIGAGGNMAGNGYVLSGTVGQPDAADLAGGGYFLAGGFWSPTVSECSPAAPAADSSGLNKGRFISFSPSGCDTALRVTLVSLHHVSPPYTGGPSLPFTSFEGRVRWVGPSLQYMESTTNTTPFYAAVLQCTPYYHDWSTVGLLHVTGSAIVPSSMYEVENVAASCAGVEASCTAVSAPLQIATGRWGDVEVPFNPPSTTAQPDFGDVAALVNKFKGAPGAPIKARSLLAGADAFGNITTLNVDVGFANISACVDAFRGRPYPYTISSCP